MPTEFTVIQAVRQRFGSGPANQFPFESQAPSVGNSKDFPFTCPNVDPREMAILQFESLGVHAGRFAQERDILQINGVDIPGAITPGPHQPESDDTAGERIWKTHSLIVPANVLKEKNVLHVEAISITGPGVNPDQFIVDNFIVFYKTQQSPRGGGTADPNRQVAATKVKTKSSGASKKKSRANRALRK